MDENRDVLKIMAYQRGGYNGFTNIGKIMMNIIIIIWTLYSEHRVIKVIL